MLLTYTQPRQTVTPLTYDCRRCGKPSAQAAITVCIGCRAQEQVARHIPPSAHWFRSR
jgi:ribosomal protein L37E